MASYTVNSRFSPEKAMEKAIAYFGAGGLGLAQTQEGPCCATFTGGGGHVTVMASTKDGKTVVDLATREWDYHVQRFMHEIA